MNASSRPRAATAIAAAGLVVLTAGPALASAAPPDGWTVTDHAGTAASRTWTVSGPDVANAPTGPTRTTPAPRRTAGGLLGVPARHTTPTATCPRPAWGLIRVRTGDTAATLAACTGRTPAQIRRAADGTPRPGQLIHLPEATR